MDPSHSGIKQPPQTRGQNTALRTVRELRSCAGQPARRCLPLRGPSETARRSGNRPAFCRRLGVRPGQHRRERLGDLLRVSAKCRSVWFGIPRGCTDLLVTDLLVEGRIGKLHGGHLGHTDPWVPPRPSRDRGGIPLWDGRW